MIWDPYSFDAVNRRAPHLRVSPLCYRDRGFWLTKEKLVFDVYVHNHPPERIMRQFGLHQEFPAPVGDRVNRAKQR